MRILLDSNAYSAFMRGSDEVRDLIRGAEAVLFSAVVVGEQLYGFRQGTRFEQNLAELRSFLERPYVSFVPVGPVTADRYSRVMTALRGRGGPFRPTTSGSRPTPWRQARTWFPPTATSSTLTVLRGSECRQVETGYGGRGRAGHRIATLRWRSVN